ncbi:MAG TPA: hypothetical protein VFX65_01325 [Candidatus Limnocylindrales bacterium]|jgi:hypothetical protein|nr:hypothetical protein [Candidatus Limnocylindrales bacterium]
MSAYSWIVYGHVVTVILAFMAHGVSGFVMFRARSERDRGRLAGILELSSASLTAAGILLLVAIVSGIWAAVAGGHFAKFWPWASIIVLVVVIGSMTPLAAIPMGKIRTALGLGRVKAGEPQPVPASDEDLAAAVARLRPEIPAAIGVIGILLLAWMMRFKPF